jgi:hypothetical protein
MVSMAHQDAALHFGVSLVLVVDGQHVALKRGDVGDDEPVSFVIPTNEWLQSKTARAR